MATFDTSSQERRNQIEGHIQSILKLIGEDSTREGLIDTPKRVARCYDEIFGGYKEDVASVLSTTFEEENSEMIIVRNIAFYSHCEHHIVTFCGKIHIGYIPNGRVIGISKLARVADIFSRRLQIQERLTTQIADSIDKYLKPQGVAVVIEAEHLCMKMRGIKNPCADTVTSAVRGEFENAEVRMEFLQLIRSSSDRI
jgi:GTP cyclohydrolase I